MKKKIAVLGATGSVGRQALDVAREYGEEIDIVCLSANENYEELARLANEFKPQYLAMRSVEAAARLKSGLTYDPIILSGHDAIRLAAIECGAGLVVLAVLGISGLPVFEACLLEHVPVALANKESIVCGAGYIRRLMDDTGTMVLPVDSEHSAIFQCLGNNFDVSKVEKIWLTASGGPFLHLGKEEIDSAPPERALKHPNWNMGKKISVDSASLANKGLEVIEAHFLYKMPGDKIEVVIQPKSLIHSMVEFRDSSVLAQFAPIDMRLPLQKMMLYPKMCKFTMNKPLDFKKLGTIEFIEPDMERFPCLKLAYRAIELGATAVYNIANEEAVDYYLSGRINFGGISGLVETCMARFSDVEPRSVGEIMELDERVRRYIKEEYRPKQQEE